MNIHEYQAKALLKDFGIKVPKGVILLDPSAAGNLHSFDGPVVVKAQVHAGGRGKAGGIKVAKDLQQAIEVAEVMFGSVLVTKQTGASGKKVRMVYLEEASSIKGEYYLSAVINRKTDKVSFIASAEGGMDIEEVASKDPDKIKKVSIDPASGFLPCHSRKLGYAMGLNKSQITAFHEVTKRVYDLFISKDASQMEINPLIENELGDFVALDAKINFDQNALYKHPDIVSLRDEAEENPMEREAGKYGLNYIQMSGDIGCMVNGAGLAMATMDIIKSHKGEPANFLDVGGAATLETVSAAFKIILADKGVKAVLVNIFGGIMKCDIIAEGIVGAVKEIGIDVPLVVRLSGTNFEIGKKILQESGLKVLTADTLDEAAERVMIARNEVDTK